MGGGKSILWVVGGCVGWMCLRMLGVVGGGGWMEGGGRVVWGEVIRRGF